MLKAVAKVFNWYASVSVLLPMSQDITTFEDNRVLIAQFLKNTCLAAQSEIAMISEPWIKLIWCYMR